MANPRALAKPVNQTSKTANSAAAITALYRTKPKANDVEAKPKVKFTKVNHFISKPTKPLLRPQFYEQHWTDERLIEQSLESGKVVAGRLFFDKAESQKTVGFVMPDPIIVENFDHEANCWRPESLQLKPIKIWGLRNLNRAYHLDRVYVKFVNWIEWGTAGSKLIANIDFQEHEKFQIHGQSKLNKFLNEERTKEGSPADFDEFAAAKKFKIESVPPGQVLEEQLDVIEEKKPDVEEQAEEVDAGEDAEPGDVGSPSKKGSPKKKGRRKKGTKKGGKVAEAEEEDEDSSKKGESDDSDSGDDDSDSDDSDEDDDSSDDDDENESDSDEEKEAGLKEESEEEEEEHDDYYDYEYYGQEKGDGDDYYDEENDEEEQGEDENLQDYDEEYADEVAENIKNIKKAGITIAKQESTKEKKAVAKTTKGKQGKKSKSKAKQATVPSKMKTAAKQQAKKNAKTASKTKKGAVAEKKQAQTGAKEGAEGTEEAQATQDAENEDPDGQEDDGGADGEDYDNEDEDDDYDDEEDEEEDEPYGAEDYYGEYYDDEENSDSSDGEGEHSDEEKSDEEGSSEDDGSDQEDD